LKDESFKSVLLSTQKIRKKVLFFPSNLCDLFRVFKQNLSKSNIFEKCPHKYSSDSLRVESFRKGVLKRRESLICLTTRNMLQLCSCLFIHEHYLESSFTRWPLLDTCSNVLRLNTNWQCRASGNSDILCTKKKQSGKDSVIERQPLLLFM
jgi:hypothetical protein